MSHEWLLKFLQHRIADKRVLRLITKWLKAGFSDGGKWNATTKGCPQGSVLSPLLSNIYLHYTLDLWVQAYRTKKAKGDILIVRYGDDFILGFQYEGEANEFLYHLKERLSKFDLQLHEQKTKLIRFGRYAKQRRKERGEGRPETFEFLGFTHICVEAHLNQKFVKWLHRVVRGYFNYHAVPGNLKILNCFRRGVLRTG